MKTKHTITIIIVLIVLAVAILWYRGAQAKKMMMQQNAPATNTLEQAAEQDNTDQIDQNLNSINVDASSTEDFKSVDGDINSI